MVSLHVCADEIKAEREHKNKAKKYNIETR